MSVARSECAAAALAEIRDRHAEPLSDVHLLGVISWQPLNDPLAWSPPEILPDLRRRDAG